MSDAISDGYDAGCLFHWANGDGKHGIPTVANLEADGWVNVREAHPTRRPWREWLRPLPWRYPRYGWQIISARQSAWLRPAPGPCLGER